MFTRQKDKVSEKSIKSMRAVSRSSFRNLIYDWKPCYILNYTPRYILNRATLLLYYLRHPDHPWLTEQANSILSTLLMPKDVGLEWGSGRSTLWFAQRIKRLTSVEHDEAWYKVVSSKLKAANISNVNYLLCRWDEEDKRAEESSYVQVVEAFNKESLDFVVVDGVCRDVCVTTVLEKIRPGGIIVVDNVNWYLPCDSISPNSRRRNSLPASEEWARFLDRVKDWRSTWTSNGVCDTAIWFKPSGECNDEM